jgi:hypothetical protein
MDPIGFQSGLSSPCLWSSPLGCLGGPEVARTAASQGLAESQPPGGLPRLGEALLPTSRAVRPVRGFIGITGSREQPDVKAAEGGKGIAPQQGNSERTEPS